MTQKKPSPTDFATTLSQSNKPSRKFFALTAEEWTETTNKLTKTEIQILYFLRAADPYSNGISAKSRDLATKFNSTQRSVNRAIARLKELNLIKAEPTEWELKLKVRCLDTDTNVQVETPVSSVRRQCPNRDINVQVETPMSSTETLMSSTETLMSRFDSESLVQSEFQEPKNIKINKNLNTSLGQEKEKFFDSDFDKDQDATQSPNNQAAIALNSSRKLDPRLVQTSPTSALPSSAYDKFLQNAHPALIYSEDIPWLIPPQGRTFTRFLPQFLDWGANEFMRDYGKSDFYKAHNDFLSFLKNSPDKIEAKWEQYCSQVTHKAVVMASRVKAEIAITEEEKQFLLENQGAIAPLESLKVDSKVLTSVIPEGTEGINTYKEFAGDTDNFWRKLASKKSMPRALPQEVESDEKRWYRWLHSGDSKIIELAIKQAKKAGYEVLYNGDRAYGFTKGGEV